MGITPIYGKNSVYRKFTLMWDFAPSSEPKFIAEVYAISIHEAFNTLITYVDKGPLDIWEK